MQCPQGSRSDPAEGETRLLDDATLDAAVGGQADQGVVAVAAGELVEPRAPGEPDGRHDDGGHDLTLREIRSIDAAEEFHRGDLALDTPPRYADDGIDTEETGRQFGCWICQGDATAEGATSADSPVTDIGHSLRDERGVACNER